MPGSEQYFANGFLNHNSGKTFVIVRAIIHRMLRASNSRHAALRFRNNAARASLALDTVPKVVELCFPGLVLTEHGRDGFFEAPNGSQLWIGGLDDKARVEKILGTEFVTVYLNEASQISYEAVLVARTRLAQVCEGVQQRMLVDLNPPGKGHWTNKMFVQKVDPQSGRPLSNPSDYIAAHLNPVDNAHNLSAEYLDSLRDMPPRQRQRFYEGSYVDEIEGALWTYEGLEQGRREAQDIPRDKRTRVVVAVDPSGNSGREGERSDLIGIVPAALGEDGHGYVLADLSVSAGPTGPDGWAARAVNAYHLYEADHIVAERNYGGEMVRAVIQAVDSKVPVELVTATRGKVVRAEPVATLYASGKVHHVGQFGELEEQLCAFTSSGYGGSGSPDRADATVWAITDLMLRESTFAPPPVAQFGSYVARRF